MSDEELARKREHRMMVRAERTGISRQGGWHRRILANFVPQTEKVCGTFLVQNDRYPCRAVQTSLLGWTWDAGRKE